MSQIICPTIDLYLYDLRDGLGENPTAVAENQTYFQAKLPPQIHSSLFDRDIDFEAEFVQLLGQTKIAPLPKNCASIEGCYYPVRIGDTYGLLLNCSAANTTEPQPVSYLELLKKYIDPEIKGQTATIGQTWMISGELPQGQNTSPQELAQACYKAVMPDGNWQQDFRGEGRFLGGYIFELWRYKIKGFDAKIDSNQKPLIKDIQDNYHVVIALYPNALAAKTAARYNWQEWIRLFSYRAKILWAYGQSRYLKVKLKQDFVNIQFSIAKIEAASHKNPKIGEIQEILASAQQTQARYSINLIYLEYQLKTLEINLANYLARYHRITQISSEVESALILPNRLKSISNTSNLEFLKKFGDEVQEKYLRQLQKDYETLKPGEELLAALMNSIESLRVIVETDRSQHDRRFQNNITIIGLGFTAASLTASVSGQFPNIIVPATILTEEDANAAASRSIPELLDTDILGSWLAPSISLFFSLAVGAVVMAVTWLFIRVTEKE